MSLWIVIPGLPGDLRDAPPVLKAILLYDSHKIILSGDALLFGSSLFGTGQLTNHNAFTVMKKIVLIYGLIAGAIILGVSYLVFVVLGDQFSHLQNEFFGYLVMVVGLSMIFVGVKQYRDKYLGGVIKFGKAFLVGFYIALVASTIYVANWEVYMQTAGSEDFITSYQNSMIEKMRENGATEAEINAQIEQNEYYADMYNNTFFRILITYSEILPAGLIISLLSAALLKNAGLLPDPQTSTQPDHHAS